MSFLITILAIFFSFVINSFAGFGGGIVAVPFLALLFPLTTVSPFMNLLGFSGNLLLIKSFYKHIRYQLLLPLVIGNLFGGITGVHFLVIASNSLLVKILGITILLSAIIMLVADRKISFKPNFFIGMLVGLISGILSALFAVGGAPIILYFSGILKEKNAFRANSLAFFLINSGTQVLLFISKGLVTNHILLLFLLSLPFIILGNFLGQKMYHKTSKVLFRKIIFVILVISGMILFIKF